jgi:transglutaminase-like putative cysteine protease
MFAAPQPTLTGALGFIANGHRGVMQTLQIMRAMVRNYRTDPRMISTARAVIYLTPPKMQMAEVDALLRFVQSHVRYVQDVHEVETLSTPDKTLAARVGDCDDQVTLLATLLEAVGYPTRFIVAGYSVPGQFEHVYLESFASGQWVAMDPTESQPLGWEPPGAVSTEIEGA